MLVTEMKHQNAGRLCLVRLVVPVAYEQFPLQARTLTFDAHAQVIGS
jgi:hypothetical protein